MPDQPMGKQEFKCTQCGKMLQSQNELQEHQKTHKGQQQGGGPGSTGQASGGQSGR
jgi:C2H2-type zinc finger